MRGLKWWNTTAFAAMVLVNAFANILPLGGNTTGEVAARYPGLFSPAPLTFAIWGLIYLSLAAFALYQWEVIGGTAKTARRLRNRIGLWFTVSCVMNIAWIFSWHFGAIGLSMVWMLGLLGSLWVIQGRLRGAEGDGLSRVMVNAGFDIYFGWIIAATIANGSVLMSMLGVSIGQLGTSILLLMGAGIACLLIRRQGGWLSASAIVWAYMGILIRHISASGYGGTYPYVIVSAVLGICMIVFAMILTMERKMSGEEVHTDRAVRYERA